jgi:plasmid stabilization system protein ParE
MTRELILLPALSRDFREAFEYYEALSPTRGGPRFEASFRSALHDVKRGFVTHLRCFDYFHRVVLKRFPYFLYYRLVGNQAVVVAVLYARMDPKKIDETLKQRL